MPSLEDLKPFLVLGLALGGVFAMSGVGLVVLFRATGVLNLAYGAIGATVRPDLMVPARRGQPWIAYAVGIAFGGRDHPPLRGACSGRRSRPVIPS